MDVPQSISIKLKQDTTGTTYCVGEAISAALQATEPCAQGIQPGKLAMYASLYLKNPGSCDDPMMPIINTILDVVRTAAGNFIRNINVDDRSERWELRRLECTIYMDKTVRVVHRDGTYTGVLKWFKLVQPEVALLGFDREAVIVDYDRWVDQIEDLVYLEEESLDQINARNSSKKTMDEWIRKVNTYDTKVVGHPH